MHLLASVSSWGRESFNQASLFSEISEIFQFVRCLCSERSVADVSFNLFFYISPLCLHTHFHVNCFVLYFCFFSE